MYFLESGSRIGIYGMYGHKLCTRQINSCTTGNTVQLISYFTFCRRRPSGTITSVLFTDQFHPHSINTTHLKIEWGPRGSLCPLSRTFPRNTYHESLFQASLRHARGNPSGKRGALRCNPYSGFGNKLPITYSWSTSRCKAILTT